MGDTMVKKFGDEFPYFLFNFNVLSSCKKIKISQNISYVPQLNKKEHLIFNLIKLDAILK